MTYRVILLSAARKAAQDYLEYIALDQKMPLTAERWWRRALAAIDTLACFPHRCPKPPENDFRDYTVRGLRVDSGLFLYTVDEEKHTVRIIGFRHSRQQPVGESLPNTPNE